MNYSRKSAKGKSLTLQKASYHEEQIIYIIYKLVTQCKGHAHFAAAVFCSTAAADPPSIFPIIIKSHKFTRTKINNHQLQEALFVLVESVVEVCTAAAALTFCIYIKNIRSNCD